jgi:hypothetical protein
LVDEVSDGAIGHACFLVRDLILLRIVRRRFQLAAASDVGPQLAPALSYFVELFYF